MPESYENTVKCLKSLRGDLMKTTRIREFGKNIDEKETLVRSPEERTN